MKWEAVAVIVTCAVTCGSVLVFLGRQLQVLTQISLTLKEQGEELAAMRMTLTQVKQKQDDCGNCP